MDGYMDRWTVGERKKGWVDKYMSGREEGFTPGKKEGREGRQAG